MYICVCVNMAWLFYHVDSTFLSFRFFLEGAEVAGINRGIGDLCLLICQSADAWIL